MSVKGKSTLTLFLFIFAGIVLGGFLGTWLGQYDFFYWLAYRSEEHSLNSSH